MRPKSSTPETALEHLVRDIRRATRKQYSAEEKIRIVLDGLRGEVTIAELCRREGIAESLYYGWSKEFLEAGKRRLVGDTARSATTSEVKDTADHIPPRSQKLITAPSVISFKSLQPSAQSASLSKLYWRHLKNTDIAASSISCTTPAPHKLKRESLDKPSALVMYSP